MPSPYVRGTVLEYMGERVKLIRRHPDIAEMWECLNISNGQTEFRHDSQLGTDVTVVSTPTAPFNVCLTAMKEIHCTFCETKFRFRKRRLICADCKTQGAGQCVYCGMYQGRVVLHLQTCSVAKRFECISCHNRSVKSPTVMPLRPDGIRPTLCQSCVSHGIGMCKKCRRAYTVHRESHISSLNFCDRCHPVPQASVWRSMKNPIGGPPVIETKSWRCFGIESEVYHLPEKMRKTIPLEDMEFFSPKRWQRGTDSSIKAPDGATQKIEFRSPPFCGDQGLQQLRQDILFLRETGWRANRSTGLHVHIDISDVAPKDLQSLEKFARWYEYEVFDFVHPSRRINEYCSPIALGSPRGHRYLWFNLEAYTKYRTIEIRLHHGTTRPRRVKEWVVFCLAFVEAGLKYGNRTDKPRESLYTLMSFSNEQIKYWESVKAKMRTLT